MGSADKPGLRRNFDSGRRVWGGNQVGNTEFGTGYRELTSQSCNGANRSFYGFVI